ncbi:hypothetical protein [Streptomyces adelaidensis]|uniref:hypothetical protein n=1 Tax=Streptomyces adelaidensis TaxID=2796465 RepID=UPI0019065AD8|nr:hypothetical protein [Streptomyces adelaidensis]
MLEVLIAVLGAVVGASALLVSIAGHRHNVRQAERLAERERRIEAREREADQRERLTQSSMLHVAMVSGPSVLADGFVRWRLEAVNTSNQPLLQVAVHYDGVRLDAREVLPAGGALTVNLPTASTAGAPPSALLCSVDFTDTSGSRWRRLATGGLQPQAAGGGEAHWYAPVAPIVSPHVPMSRPDPGGIPGGPPPDFSTPPFAGRPMEPLSRRAHRPAVAAVILAVAAAVYLIVRYVG